MRIIDRLVHRIKSWSESVSPIVNVQIKSDISCSQHKITICIFPHHTKQNAINNNNK